jgi:hypothetical protein
MRLRWKSLFWVYIVAVLAIHGFVFWQSRHLIGEGFPDFSIYYSAGWVARHGLTHQFYDNATHFEVQQQFAGRVKQFRDPLPFTHPPFEAWYFAPFSYASFTTAYILWDIANVLLLGVVVWLLRPYLTQFRPFSILEALLVALAFFPIFFCLLQGQDAILILLFYAFAYVLMRKQRYVAAGSVLALGLFKFHLIAPFVLLAVFWRERKLWLGFIPASLLLALLSLAMVGTQGISNYPRFVLLLENAMSGSEKIPAGMPSIRGLLYLLCPSGWNTGLLLTASCIAVLAYTAWRSSRREVNSDLRFSLAMIATALVGYHVVSYDLSMLLLPMALISNYLLRRASYSLPSKMMMVAMALLFFSPLQLLLSVQYKDFALIAIVLLIWFYGIAREISSGGVVVQSV